MATIGLAGNDKCLIAADIGWVDFANSKFKTYVFIGTKHFAKAILLLLFMMICIFP